MFWKFNLEKRLKKHRYLIYDSPYNYFPMEFTGEIKGHDVDSKGFHDFATVKVASNSFNCFKHDYIMDIIPQIVEIEISLYSIKKYGHFISKRKFDKEMEFWNKTIVESWVNKNPTYFIDCNGDYYKRCGDITGTFGNYKIPIEDLDLNKNIIEYGENSKKFKIVSEQDYNIAETEHIIKFNKCNIDLLKMLVNRYINKKITDDRLSEVLIDYLNGKDYANFHINYRE